MEILEDEEVEKHILEDSGAELEEIKAAHNQISNGETLNEEDDDENFAYETTSPPVEVTAKLHELELVCYDFNLLETGEFFRNFKRGIDTQ